jgi:hypothetical protein
MVLLVESYSATVAMPSTTVPSTVPYSVHDGNLSLCSNDGIDDDGWTSIIKRTKTGRPGRLSRMQGHLERPREASICEK